MLHTTTTELEEKREDFAKQIWAGMDEDKFLGPCKVCEEAGRKRENGEPEPAADHRPQGRQAHVRLRGLDTATTPSRPDSCPVSGPLPGRFYELWRLEERCSVCGERPRLTVKKRFRGRPWKLCLNDDCPTMVEMREKRAEREAAKEAARGGQGGRPTPTATGAGHRRGGGRRGRRRRRRRAGGDGPKKPAPTTARTKRARSGN